MDDIPNKPIICRQEMEQEQRIYYGSAGVSPLEKKIVGVGSHNLKLRYIYMGIKHAHRKDNRLN